jgi:ferritin
MINNLVDLAIKEKDHATFEALQWFVKEQVEEEMNAATICDKIKTVGDIPGHLLCLDHDLSKRK